MRGRHLLSARTVSTIKDPGRYSDGDGLYLLVRNRGAEVERLWFYRYRRGGRGSAKEMTVCLGRAKDVSLAEARDAAEACRRAAKDGREVRQALARHRNKGGVTFGAYADAKIADLCKGFKNDKHKAQWTMTLGDAYCRSIRGKPIDTVSTADVLAILQPIWQTKPETASRIRGRIEKVLDSATAEGHRKGDNPARWRGHLDAVLSKPSKLTRGHHRALPWQDMPSFMERLRGYQSMSALALEWCILTASRTQETAHARRSEIDIKARVWTVPATRMKGKREHRVPLCDRCLEIFEEATKLNSSFLFPGTNFRHPLSLSAMAEFLKGLSVNATVHGFRSSFRDWCGDATSYPEAIAEAALAHTIGNKTEAAYRRGDALERRRELMAAWARYLDKKDNVVELRTTSGQIR